MRYKVLKGHIDAQESENALLPLLTAEFIVISKGKTFRISLECNMNSSGVSIDISEVKSMPDSPPANTVICLSPLSACR
jgi:hypothetical protein